MMYEVVARELKPTQPEKAHLQPNFFIALSIKRNFKKKVVDGWPNLIPCKYSKYTYVDAFC